ncbi:Gfo/Idh/MocA family protein [Streptomyces flavidovirens]|uniref:Gfo/Idh/MocA family protein n=1 Tax=Streptomyces flavidovirens TaxID=67298 RepID=UPI000564F8E8|nr:Gfo/Idh/MocA family oxidoreductase [Streptomyces flavidovirens]
MAEPVAANPPLRIGVLGCADIARRRLLPAFAGAPDTEVAAVASRDGRRAAAVARRYGCVPVEGYAELLAMDSVDAVYVPLPVALHAPWTEAALRAGKHVLAEKPLTTDPAATRRLLSLARTRGLVLMENVMFLHHPQHIRVRELLDDGAIGELRSFSARFGVPRLPAGDIRHAPELGGGALLDIGIYPARAAAYFLGSPLSVAGAVLERGSYAAVETSGTALLRSKRGVTAQLAFGMDHGYRSSYELWGSAGRITLERAFTPPPDHRPVIRLKRGGRAEEIVLEPADQVSRTVRAFAAACRAGLAGAPDAQACMEQAELLDGIRRLSHTPYAAEGHR